MLTIENPQKLIGKQYSEIFDIIGVKEHKHHYEFTLGYASIGPNKTETILLHRRQTSDKRYIMEYNGQTLWVTKDRLNTIDGVIECMREI